MFKPFVQLLKTINLPSLYSAFVLEQPLLKKLKKHKYLPKKKFNGYTECFSANKLILKEIKTCLV